jgi:DNA repair protein RadC
LRRLGPEALATRELLALLVGSGGPTGSALDVADRLIARTGGALCHLAVLETAELAGLAGVGPATAGRIRAALELGRRANREGQPARPRINGPEDLLLNTQNRVVRDVLVTRGILDASLVHPREVFRLAVSEAAAAVILVHNHPSGDPSPSLEDRAVTRQIATAGRALGIPVLDHVVVGHGRYASLAALGELTPPGH